MKITEKIKENYSAEALILAFVCIITGIAFGILVSPVKNGITVGSYNGCNNQVKSDK
ncbi:MAG: hypothetical protein K2J47_07820 [Ruminococcus sp.]|nr:hypothetical protein [Ruminococcus sp.]